MFEMLDVPTINTHGIDLTLKPFAEDVKDLSANGLTISDHLQLPVALVAFLADNLAAHTLGFKESMSFTKRICRTCMSMTEKVQLFLMKMCSNYEIHSNI